MYGETMSTEEDKKRGREKSRIWRALHPEKKKEETYKYRLEHQEYIREKNRFYSNKYQANNPDISIAKKHNYRSRKAGNGGTITAKEWNDLKAHYNYTCLCCGRREPEIKLTLDHVVPIKLGGGNIIQNAQPLCTSCNCSKKDKHIDYR